MFAAPETTGQITWSYVHDLTSATRFYSDVLNLEQVLDQGGCRIFRVAPAAYLGVCEARPGRVVEPRGTLVTFVTDEVEAWYERLCAADVDVDGPPQALVEFGIYAFFATGPDGYRFEFQRFDNPDWAVVSN